MIALIMHQTINEILRSTQRRIPLQKKKRVIAPRNFHDVIKARKQQKLIPLIAEIKPSSPSQFIRNVTPMDAEHIAGEMEAGGAAAISVLTEPQFFKGSIENLASARRAVGIPLLRKDFIIDKAQIYEEDSDLILLIAGILGDKLNDFVDECISFGCEPLVEVHNKNELENALSTHTSIIGINNRDLNTLKVDITTTEKLAPLISDRIIVSESGISAPPDAVRMIEAGADALLIGTYIMKGNIYYKTYELVHALNYETET